MVEHISRTEGLTVGCPYCRAEPGAPCVGARDKVRETCHKEREDAYLRDRRELRFYDLDQSFIPEGHRDGPPPAREPTRIPDDERVRGLAHCHQILEQLAARGLATGRQHP